MDDESCFFASKREWEWRHSREIGKERERGREILRENARGKYTEMSEE